MNQELLEQLADFAKAAYQYDPRPLSYRKCGWGGGGTCHRRKGERLQCTPNLTWGRAGQCGH